MLVRPIGRVSRAACGYYHTVVVTEDGRVWEAAHDDEDQQRRSGWVLVAIPVEAGAVAAGRGFSCVVGSHDAALYLWGDCPALGQSPDKGIQKVSVPGTVGQPRALACFPTGLAIAAASGELFVWGQNRSGELGVGDRRPRRSLTLCVLPWPDDERVAAVACGPTHFVVVSDTGQIAVAGLSPLLRGETSTVLRPVPQPDDASRVVAAACTMTHVALLDECGLVSVDGAPALRQIPDSVVTVSGGYGHFVVRTIDNKVFGWGRGCEGQLLGTIDESPEPTLIAPAAYLAVCGGWHTAIGALDCPTTEPPLPPEPEPSAKPEVETNSETVAFLLETAGIPQAYVQTLGRFSLAHLGGFGDAELQSVGVASVKIRRQLQQALFRHLGPSDGSDGDDDFGPYTCCICASRGVNVVFLPCAHLVTCQECSARCDECPLCRTRTARKITVYLP